MTLILNIETSTTLCSVSIANNGEIVDCIEIDDGYSHAENLHVFIDEILKKNDLIPKNLNAIAVGKGPGSYTGLRIGVSAAKGLAFALTIPLISLNTLQILAKGLQELMPEAKFICPMLDARRMEVYTGVFDSELMEVSNTEALIITNDSIEKLKQYNPIYFCGNGFVKAKEFLNRVPNAIFHEDIKPSAKQMSSLSYQKFLKKDFESTTYFEPFYLKDFLILKKI